MELIYPSYYKAFQCIAADCPDSCCHQWEVEVDDASAEFYRSLEGDLGNALRKALYTEDGATYLRNEADRCPMWRPDGLCRIQAELGEEALCQVCTQFPRLKHDYGSFIEHGLEMSCPEAARIMLTCKDWHLVSESDDAPGEEDYDEALMALLRATRPYALELLAEKALPAAHRLAILLLYGYHVQAAIDGGALTAFDPQAALQEAMEFAADGDLKAVTDFCLELEILTEDWRSKLTAHPKPVQWDEMLCKLAAYGVYRWWYQAVSDWDLVARMKLVLLLCILSRLCGSPADCIRTAQLCSKEIENNLDNVEAILDAAYSHSALTDANLLGLILKG